MVHLSPPDRLNDIMSTRFSHLEWDGEKSDLSTALELAIDSHWYGLGRDKWRIGFANIPLLKAPFFCLLVKLRIVSLPQFCQTSSVDGHMLVVMALWNGDIVQKGNEDHDIDCWWPVLSSSSLTIHNFQTSPTTATVPGFS